jgi:choline dehydrogenase-like flavoprotein
VPWWGYAKQARKELGFPRGYHVEMGGGRTMPSLTLLDLTLGTDQQSRGAALRARLRQRFGSVVRFSSRGEMIPNEDCYCELDPAVKDQWGIPVLRFHWKWGAHELRQAEHAVTTFLELIEKLGGTPVGKVEREGAKAISKGGEIIHEVGTSRMGDRPENSVVNRWQQVWGVDNLFVMDGGVMASSPDKNPTLTILALAWRAAANLADMAQRGEL